MMENGSECFCAEVGFHLNYQIPAFGRERVHDDEYHIILVRLSRFQQGKSLQYVVAVLIPKNIPRKTEVTTGKTD